MKTRKEYEKKISLIMKTALNSVNETEIPNSLVVLFV